MGNSNRNISSLNPMDGQVRMAEAKDAIVKLADAAGCAVAVSD